MRVRFWSVLSKHDNHLVQSFFISNSSCKIYPTRSFEMPIVSAISRTHFYPPVIQYHIVHLFNDFCCCIFWTSFTWIIFKADTATFKLGSLFLNCWKRSRTVHVYFYELRMNFIWRETFFYKEVYNRTILSFIHFKWYRQHSCFRQLYKTNYLIEWLAISHGCLWQMYHFRKKKSSRYCCHLWSRPKTFQTTCVYRLLMKTRL